MLAKVKRPDVAEITFKYDALGRRIEKCFNNRTFTKWVWDGNVPLHEWKEIHIQDYETDKGYFTNIEKQPVVTWVFEEGTFVPTAKLTLQKEYSIVTNYLGTPEAMYNSEGENVWSCELNSYGKVRSFEGQTKTDCPFRYQGQYEDAETGLYYNRFRYYSPEEGMYLSQDPIGLNSGELNFYSYVSDTNTFIDEFGLAKQGVHGVAPDYLEKGLHGTFDGVELSIRPGQNGEISYKKVFSNKGDISSATKNADEYFSKSKNVKKALHNLEGSKSYYDKLGKGREWREMKRALEKKLKLCTG